MGDLEWRELERRLTLDPGDEALVAQAVAARRRAGVPVPHRLLAGLTRPGFTLTAPVPLDVAIARHGVRDRAVGATGRGPLVVPAHVAWSVSPVLRNERAPRDEQAERVTDWLSSASGAWPEDDPPELDLEDWPRRRLDWVGRLPWLRGLRLGRDPNLRDADLAAIEPLHALEQLDIDGRAVTDAGVVRLASLRGLTFLALRCPQVGDTAMSWIARLERLSALRLWSHGATDAGLERLAPLAQLDSLALEAETLGRRGLDALTRLESLRALTLRRPLRLTEADLADFRAKRSDVALVVR